MLKLKKQLSDKVGKHSASHRVLKKAIYTLLISAILILQLPSAAEAITIEPFFKDYLLEQGSTLKDSFTVTNTSEDTATFNVTVSGYNAQEEQFARPEETAIFVTPITETVTIAPNESKNVNYEVAIPESVDLGSHFNVVVLEEVLPQGSGDDKLSLKMGFGMITAMHVVEEGGTVKGAFQRNTLSILELIERGIPYYEPTIVDYTYDNPTDFVFQPIGEIRIYDSRTDELVYSERINEDEGMVYGPGAYEQRVEADIWTYDNLTHGFTVVARTYNHLDEGYIESSIEIPGFSPVTFFVLGLILLVPLYLVLRILKWIFGGRRKKRNPKKVKPGKKLKKAKKEVVKKENKNPKKVDKQA